MALLQPHKSAGELEIIPPLHAFRPHIPRDIPLNDTLDPKSLDSITESLKRHHALLSSLQAKLANPGLSSGTVSVDCSRCRSQSSEWSDDHEASCVDCGTQNIEHNIELVQRSIDTHMAILSPSPIRSLSPEILSEIFLHYYNSIIPLRLWPDFELELGIQYECFTTLQVCRHWRAIALATPRLWMALFLVFSPQYAPGPSHFSSQFSEQRRLEFWRLFQTQIERAQHLPRHLYFCILDDARSTSVDRSQCIDKLFTLLPSAVVVQLHLECGDSHHFAGPVLSAPRVRTLELLLDKASFKIGGLIVKKSLNVEALRISADAFSLYDPIFVDASVFLGKRLRVLDIQKGSIALVTLLDILDAVPTLDDLRVDRIGENDEQNITLVPLDRVVLHSRISHLLTCSNVFGHLTLPSVDTLRMDTCVFTEDFVGFLTRSRCPLRRLVLQGDFSDSFLEFLSRHPTLEIIQINVSGYQTRGEYGSWRGLRRDLWAGGRRAARLVSAEVIDCLLAQIEDNSANCNLPRLEKIALAVKEDDLPRVKLVLDSRWNSPNCCQPTDLDLLVQIKRDGSEIIDEHPQPIGSRYDWHRHYKLVTLASEKAAELLKAKLNLRRREIQAEFSPWTECGLILAIEVELEQSWS